VSDYISPFFLQDPHVFETLFNAALDAWAIADDRGNYLDANPAACELFGLSRSDLIGCHLSDFTFQGFDFESAWQQFLEQGQDKGEFQLIRRDREVYEVEYTAKAKVISGYHLLIWRDVTARKRAEDRVQVLENLLAQTTAVPPPSHPDSLEAMQKTDEERYRLQQIARHIPGAIYQFTLYPDGRSCFPYASEGLREIYGVPPEAVRQDATLVLQTIHPDELAYVSQSIQDSAEQLTPWRCEYRVCHPDGRLLWAIGHATPQREVDGSTIWYGYIRDITAQKEAEQALRENHARLQLALEAANIGTWDWNPQTNQVAFDKQWKAMLGYEEDEIENSLSVWESLVHPEDVPEAYAQIDAHIQGKTPVYESEYRMRYKDGSYKWILDLGQIIERDEPGQPVRFIGIHYDVSERKTAELARMELIQQLQKTQEVAQLGYTYFDMATKKITWSEQVFRIFGLNPDQGEPTFKEYLKKLHPEDRTFLQQRLAEARQGVPQSFDYRIFRPNGEMRYVNARLELEVRDGEVVGMFGTEMDITDRKTAELELEQFFSISLDLLCITDIEGRFRRLNQAWESILGYTAEELTGRLFLELVHPDDVAPTLAKMSDLQHGSKVLKFVNRYRAKDGSYRCVEWLSNPCGGLVYAAARDITDRIQSEATLRGSEEKWRSLFELCPLGIALHSTQRDCIEANPAFESITGYSFAELTQLNYWDITPKAYAEIEAQKLASLKRTGRYGPYQKEYIRKNGDRISVELVSVRFTGADGQQYVWSVVADITERLRAERALRDSEAQTRALLEAIPDMMLRYNCQRAFVDYKPSESVAMLLPPEEFLGKNIYEVLPGFLADLTNEAIEGTLSTGQVQETEYDLLIADEQRSYEARFVQCGTDEVLCIVRDISDRRVAETQRQALLQESQAKSQELQHAYQELQETQIQLIQAEKMSSLGQLVAGIAHEINNPVSFIYGNLTPTWEYAQSLLELIQLYQDSYPDPPEEITDFIEEVDLDFLVEDFPKIVESMKNGAARIRDIVKSLRTFSRLDEADLKEVDLHENLDSTLILLQNRLTGVGGLYAIEVIKKYGDLPQVECYIGLLNQVLMNLLVNAIQAIEERQRYEMNTEYYCGLITITTAIESSDSVSISIKDNGIGMSPEVQGKIFNPFFTTKPIGQATGMGLATSYQIITKNHRGELSFSSVEGVGTEFTIKLPCREG
jgi:PAS domain S-box-containing protein